VGLFGRRRRQDDAEDFERAFSRDYEGDYDGDYDRVDPADDVDGVVGGDLFDGAGPGPWDEEDAPEDGLNRLDLGSVRLPVLEGAQLQVEMDPAGPVKAVHVITPMGQLTVTAYAAPRSGGLWHEVSTELATQLQQDGATVRSVTGDWGLELIAALGDVQLRFVGVDGPRWMLRGVVAGPPAVAGPQDRSDAGTKALYDLMRGTIVVRGTQPMPVRTPLPIELPPAIAQHIQTAQEDGA
jgi:hypothetical protein